MKSTALRSFLLLLTLGCWIAPAAAQQVGNSAGAQAVRVVGTVRDLQNSISLPGIPVEVVGTSQVVYTDVDGKYAVNLPPGPHELKISMEGYQDKHVSVNLARGDTPTVDIALQMKSFSEQVTVTGQLVDAETSSSEAQLGVRKNAQVITDNVGSQEMKENGDADAAGAMQRVTGLSVVDNQYVYVRGLGERYSNTTLAGSVLPTTEPDKKVVPLDMFPTALIDSVQVAKSYSPDKSAEFAGGLVQIMPIRFPNRPVADVSYGLDFFSTATGNSILLSPLGRRDWLGYDDGARALPGSFPSGKLVRRGIFTPDAGYSPSELTEFGRQLENAWTPGSANGLPGQSWSAVLGNYFGKFGVVASARHSYKEQYVEEERRFFRIASGDTLEAISDYDMRYGTQKAQLGIVANFAYQFTPGNRIALENFYSHSGRDEGRAFEGPNTENNQYYRNSRVQFTEEGLISNSLVGEHFVKNVANSLLDWRVTVGRATRDEPDLRETLYQSSLPFTGTGTFLLADESQSGFRMFNELNDDTLDVVGNWSLFSTVRGNPIQYKFGLNYVDRSRDFQSRRFRFIPTTAGTGGAVVGPDGRPLNLSQTPEQLFASPNIGTSFRFNEDTRPVDAYRGDQHTTSLYGMGDFTLSTKDRLVAGVRVERFNQDVTTFDPFGLFVSTITAENKNTDVFPAANYVRSLRANQNLRLGYSITVNRPEFRELAEFEFTDIVGSRAVRGNPNLNRALIQNVDARWERFFGGRGVVAASTFFKHFDAPIERVVIAGAQPIVTFQNAESARNFGIELEAGGDVGGGVYLNFNYTFVDSEITLAPEQRGVQTSQVRALAGQSRNLFNAVAEYQIGGFSTRVLYNFFGDRISDVGANDAPDTIEQGRGGLDVVFIQRLSKFTARLALENLTDSDYQYTQFDDIQRLYKLGRTVALSFAYNVF
jgi:hypothetical protein